MAYWHPTKNVSSPSSLEDLSRSMAALQLQGSAPFEPSIVYSENSQLGTGTNLGWAGQCLSSEKLQGSLSAFPSSGGYSAPAHQGGKLGKLPSTKGQQKTKSRGSRQGKNYRRIWEQVTKVGNGQPLETGGKLAFSEMSVEDLVRIIQSLPQDQSVVLTVSQALCYLDSRALAALLKELSKVGCPNRATELFDWLRGFEPGHELSSLCDVYTYTTMISLCGQQQQLRRGLELVAEMRSKGIQCNVHTYSALMNVCIKCGELELAIDVYNQMKAEGCHPNVVTFNTLIDVYGKTGQWEEAVRVLDIMPGEGLDPEIRTYNTAIIACNMCGQPEEALKVYDRLRAAGHTPIATTYTALISAYGKNGNLEKALYTFRQMIQSGCERNIITYNALLATCEKDGECELALQLFNQMHKEGCHPNTVSFNSLINVCAQAGKWEKAGEVFERMKVQNCKPDSMTYTALLHAFEKGGQWHRAVRIFEQMVQQGCRLDTLVHHTIIDLLWQSGVVWAQAKALQLFNSALRNYHVRLGVLQNIENGTLEASVPSLSVGVAALSLLKWLSDTRHWIEQEGPQVLGEEIVIVVGRTKNSRDQNLSIVKDNVVAMLTGIKAPIISTEEFQGGIRCRCIASEFAEWLSSCETGDALKKYVDDGLPIEMSREILVEDMETEARCREAFTAVQHFEETHRLSYQMMGSDYNELRSKLVLCALAIGRDFKLRQETVHDAILLMDRVMSTGVKIQEGVWGVFVAAVVSISARQSETREKIALLDNIDSYVNYQVGSVLKMESEVRMALNNDTSVISAIRVLTLYYERLGYKSYITNYAGSVFTLLCESILHREFINFRPSIVAAALLYCDRKAKGKVKFWPSSLAHLTGISPENPEFIGALQAAQLLESNPFVTPQGVLSSN